MSRLTEPDDTARQVFLLWVSPEPRLQPRQFALVHNDLKDNSGRVRCRELLTKNLRNFGRARHYTGVGPHASASRARSSNAPAGRF